MSGECSHNRKYGRYPTATIKLKVKRGIWKERSNAHNKFEYVHVANETAPTYCMILMIESNTLEEKAIS